MALFGDRRAAVIAMENAPAHRRTREALERRERATAEVLQSSDVPGPAISCPVFGCDPGKGTSPSVGRRRPLMELCRRAFSRRGSPRYRPNRWPLGCARPLPVCARRLCRERLLRGGAHHSFLRTPEALNTFIVGEDDARARERAVSAPA